MKRFKTKISIFLIIILVLSLHGNVVYGETSTVVKGSQSGLAVQLYGSTLGTLGIWKDANLYGVTRTIKGSFNISDAYNQFIRVSDRKKLKRIRLEGFIVPEFSETYTFSTNTDVEKTTSIWLDDKLVMDKGVSYDIQLEAGKDYHVVVEVVNESYDVFKLFWQSPSLNRSIIPKENVFVPSTYHGDKIVSYDPNGDADNDGIPNSWELNGYSVLDYGIIVPYDESLGLKKFLTSYNQASTDFDPYTDFEEVTGIGMDRSVAYPGNDPLVPAYPEVSFVTTGVKIIRNETVSNSSSVSTSTSTQRVTGNVTTDGVGTGEGRSDFKGVDSSVGASYEAGAGKVKAVVTVTVDGKFSQSQKSVDILENAVDDINKTVSGEETTSNEDETTTINTTDYAKLIVSGYYLNHGTAPIYNLNPTISISIGDEEYKVEQDSQVIKSFTVDESQRPSVIAPRSKYPLNGELVLDITRTVFGVLPGPITLTKKQTESIESGIPFGIGIAIESGDVKKIVDPNENDGNYFKNIGTWNTYLNDIRNNSAQISLKIPGSNRVTRRVYTGGSQSPTLLESLEILFNGEKKSDGLYIEGEKMNKENWQIYFRGENDVVQDVIDAIKTGDKNFDIFGAKLQPNMSVEITKSDSKAAPLILNTYFDPVDEKVHATVLATGNNEIDKVEADLSTGSNLASIPSANNVTNRVELHKKDRFTYESDRITNLEPGFEHTLIATADNGVASTQKIAVDDNYFKSLAKKGLSFISSVDIGRPGRKEVLDTSSAAEWKEEILKHPEWKQFVLGKGSRGVGLNYDIYDVSNDLYNGKKLMGIQYADRDSEFPSGLANELNNGNPTTDLRLNTVFYALRSSNNYVGIAFDNGYYIVGYTADNRYVARTLPDKTNNYRGRYFRFNAGQAIRYIDRHTVSGKGYMQQGVIVRIKQVRDGKEVRQFEVAVRAGRVDLNNIIDSNSKYYVTGMYRYRTDTDVTSTNVVSREEILAYLDNLISGKIFERLVSIKGMMAEGTDLVFVRTSEVGDVHIARGTKTMITPNSQAESILVNVFGNSRGQVSNQYVELDTWSGHSKNYSNLLFVYKGNRGNAEIAVNSDGVNMNILGYFIDRDNLQNNQSYWQYWTPLKPLRYTLMPDYADGVNQATWKINYEDVKVKGFPIRPKGYVIKVKQDAELKDLVITVNGGKHYLAIGSNSRIARDHLIYVDANAENPFDITINQDIGGSHLNGNYQFGGVSYEIVGYFYNGDLKN